ncbi:MAG: polysaccharide biosynthesis/export family protein [Planctomycetota bacterium]
MIRRIAIPCCLALLAALAAGCGYLDAERPMVRNYGRDLAQALWPPEQPPEPVVEPPSSEALARAFARWQQSVGDRREDYRVGPRDRLSVSIRVPPELQEETQFEVEVAGSGQIDCPLLGVVEVGGLTPFKIGQLLTRRYGEGYYLDPSVIVHVTQFGSKQVAVTGAVDSPGIVTLKANRGTLMEALMAAGGLTDEAGTRATITRSASEEPTAEPQRLEVDLVRLVEDPGSVENLSVLPGDVVHVPPAPEPVFYVLGYVKRPGAFRMSRHGRIGVLDAVNRAGGLSWEARPQYAYLVRQTPDGPKRYSIDLARIAGAAAPDIALRPDDRVIVSTTLAIRAYSGLTRLLGLGGQASSVAQTGG